VQTGRSQKVPTNPSRKQVLQYAGLVKLLAWRTKPAEKGRPMRAKELVIQLLYSKTNIVVLALLTIIGIVEAVPFLRHRVKKIYTRKVLGSFAWVLVRLAIAIPATILFRSSDNNLVRHFIGVLQAGVRTLRCSVGT
jgi:hypothetical protein